MTDLHIIGAAACAWFAGWQAMNMVREERAKMRKVLAQFRGGHLLTPDERARQINQAWALDSHGNPSPQIGPCPVILSGRDVWLVPGSGRRISQ